MTNYKLMYFNFKGRAELARLLFAEAKVPYEDFRFEPSDWPKHKPNTPFGQVPVLEINGTPLPQSGAIVRYLAKEFGLDGESNLESAFADMVFETLLDALSKYPISEQDKTKKAELEKKFFEENMRPTLRRFEEKYTEKVNKYKKEKKADNCFFIGKKLTYADLVIMNSGIELEQIQKGFMEEFPNLKALMERTKSRKNIKAWLEKNEKPKKQQEKTKF